MNRPPPDWAALVAERYALLDAVRVFDRSQVGVRRSTLRDLAPRKDMIPYLAGKTFWGDPMLLFNDEEVSRQIFAYGVFEIALVDFMVDFLRPGDTVFDIGAHIGFHALLAARLVGPEGQVHAFEPAPATALLLERNLAWHPAARVQRAAAWSKSEPLTLHSVGIDMSAFNTVKSFRLSADQGEPRAVREIPVEGIAIDDYVRRSGTSPTFVKVDVENAEREVLAGMEDTLHGARPVLTIEVGDREDLGSAEIGPSGGLVDWLAERDYVAVEMRRDGLVVHQRRADWDYGYDNLLMVPRERLSAAKVAVGTRLTVSDGRFDLGG